MAKAKGRERQAQRATKLLKRRFDSGHVHMIKPVRHIEPVEISDEIKQKSQEWLIARKANLPPQAIQNYRKALDPNLPILYRIRKFLLAETQSGRITKVVKDAILFFVTEFVTETIEPKSPKTMLQKILSLKNFINLRDSKGNFSMQELVASVLQIVLAGAIVWGATELGIWDKLIQVLGI